MSTPPTTTTPELNPRTFKTQRSTNKLRYNAPASSSVPATSSTSSSTRSRNTPNAPTVSLNPQFKLGPKKPFPPVATSATGVSKQNQDELKKKEQEARKLAKEAAARDLANILTQPEQLVQVEQLRLEKSDGKRLVSGILKNLIKTKLDDVQNGLVNLDEAIANLDLISTGHAKILEKCKEVGDIIPKEYYELIKEVNIAGNNLKLTKSYLESFIEISETLTYTKQLMSDDINILVVHKKLMKLQKSRAVMLKAARAYPNEARQLEAKLSGVMDLANDFTGRIKELIRNHFTLALQKPAVLIKVLQVINREKRRREKFIQSRRATTTSGGGGGGGGGNRARAKVVLVRPERKIDSTAEAETEIYTEPAAGAGGDTTSGPASPTSTSSTTTSTESEIDRAADSEFEWTIELKTVVEWIRKACVERFGAIFENCKEKGKYVLTKFIDTSNDLFNDLTTVFDDLKPCFPDWVDIFSIYCQEYHMCLNKMFKEYSNLSPEDTISLVKWINITYASQMQRLGANKEDLLPNLNEEISQLIEDYGINIYEKMCEWGLRLIDQDRSDDTKLIVSDLYYTSGPTNLFQIVHFRIEQSQSTTDLKVVLVAVRQSMAVLKKYQQEMTTTLKRQGASWQFGYLIALINNFTKCYDYTEDVKVNLTQKYGEKLDLSGVDFEGTQRGFQDLVVSSRQALITKMLEVLSEELNQLFTRPWLAQEVPSAKVIVDTLSDYFNDDIDKHITIVHHRKLALETLQRLTTHYIQAMFTKKMTFDDQVAKRLDMDLSLLTSFGINQKNKDKQVKEVLQVLIDLKELMTSESNEIRNRMETIMKRHADFREEMASYMIENRDNLERADKRSSLSEIKLAFQKKSVTIGSVVQDGLQEGVFRNLELPGGFFDSLMKDKK